MRPLAPSCIAAAGRDCLWTVSCLSDRPVYPGCRASRPFQPAFIGRTIKHELSLVENRWHRLA